MRRTTKLTFFAATLFILSACDASAPSAADAPKIETTETDANFDPGLKVGEKAPLDVKFNSSENNEATLGEVLKDGPVAIIFSRSVKWCPYCQAQLKQANTAAGQLKEMGYRLYGLTYDSPEEQTKFIDGQAITYGFLSDQKSALIDAFGLRDPQYTEGMAVGVPYASTVVIARDGTIMAKHVAEDYKIRPTNEDLIALVGSI
ncbi:MAG: redoxin domain-containing protein [Parasphingorhabdus sp.]|nr:redoxin domain-containing protein [Parasphingorhabdus sp.]